MPGGIHPPPSVLLSWPAPNFTDPVRRPKAVTILACVFGPVTMLSFLARLWVRMHIQRNAGLDDWLMMAASLPTLGVIIIIPLAADTHNFDRHVWDVRPGRYVTQRKYIMATELCFCIASGLIKVSILLFYKRLGSRAVSRTFRLVTRFTIISIIAYSTAITLLPVFACRPISAFWDQLNITKLARGYKYKCINGGAAIFSSTVISGILDLITALLPTILYWNLQISLRRKIALLSIFAMGYLVVAFGILRAYTVWVTFFITYDVTWAAWEVLIWTLLEIQLGAFCANAPALKVFIQQMPNMTASMLGTLKSSSVLPVDRRRSNQSASSSVSTLWNGNHEERKRLDTQGDHDVYDLEEKISTPISPATTSTTVGPITARSDDIEMGAPTSRSLAPPQMPQPSHGSSHMSWSFPAIQITALSTKRKTMG